MKEARLGIYRFDRFEFNTGTGELQENERTVRLAPRPAMVLTTLVEGAGGLVTRETLRALLWPETIVEFDKGLNFCVREVRAALGDNASNPAFIETLPRRGYRFITPVTRIDVDGNSGAEGGGRRGPRYRTPRPRIRLGHAAALLLLATSAAGWALARGGTSVRRVPIARARELGEMGGYLLTSGDSGNVARSVSYFRAALAADPDYARAYAGLGSAYLRLSRPSEGTAALRRSLELDPGMWASHVNLALHALYVDYDHESARAHFDRALELAPREVVVQHTASWFLAVTGDLNGAMEHMATALALDPVSPRVNGDVGRLHYLGGRYEEAVAHCRRTLELIPDDLRSRDCVVQALVQLGALHEARAEALAAMGSLGAEEVALEAVRSGDTRSALAAYWPWAGQALGRLADAGQDSYVHAAAAWARVGDKGRAFAALDRAYAAHCPALLQIGLDPALALLSGDPRYRSLLEKVGQSGTIEAVSGLTAPVH